MNNTQNISLDGKGIELPKYIVNFLGGGAMLSNSIEEIMEIQKKEKRQIESINPVKIDNEIFDTSINFIDETKALLNTFYYAVYSEDNFNEEYTTKFFSFFEMIKTIENKVQEMKQVYQNNYEMIELAERLIEKNKVA
jgi:hypothetical protein